MFLLISTNFTSTPGIPRPSPVFEPRSPERTSRVKPGDFTFSLRRPPARPLRPVIPNNAHTPRITAAAGTELAGVFFEGTFNPRASCTHGRYSPQTELYDPRAFITHAAWLRQSFLHCARFPTAASRRSLDRISVPVWLIILLDQLPIVDLVGHYPANYLMGRELISRRAALRSRTFLTDPVDPWAYPVLAVLSVCYPGHKGRLFTCYSPVRRFTQGRSPFHARLACVRPAASVRSEPGSNSPV